MKLGARNGPRQTQNPAPAVAFQNIGCLLNTVSQTVTPHRVSLAWDNYTHQHALIGKFIGYTLLVPHWISFQSCLNPTRYRTHPSEILFFIDMLASHNCKSPVPAHPKYT